MNFRARLLAHLNSGEAFSLRVTLINGYSNRWNLIEVHGDCLEVVPLGMPSNSERALILTAHIATVIIEKD